MAEATGIRSDATNSLVSIRRFAFGLIGVLLALWAQSRLREGYYVDAVLLYGAALFTTVFLFRHHVLPSIPAARIERLCRAGHWQWVPLILALAVGAATFFAFDVDDPQPYQWWLHAASVLLLLVAAQGLDLGRTVVREKAPWSRTQALLLLGIFALATALRLFRFDSLPFGVWYDEAEAAHQALRILEDPSYRPLFVDSINVTAHYLHLVRLAFEWFGVSVQSVRAVSVLMGLGTVLAGYLAGKELFGRDMGLVMAFLMAISRWNVTFSRIGMYNISTPLFELLTLAFLLRGMRTGRFTDYALAGLFVGLGLSFYPAYQLFLPVLLLFVLARWVAERSFLGKAWPGLLIVLAMTCFAVLPVARYAYAHSDTYLARVRKTSLLARKAEAERMPALLQNARKHLLMFNLRGDPNGRHNLPGEPMLDPVTGALAVLGIGLSLWWIKRPRAFLLLVWLAIGLLGGILSLDFEAPQSLRSIGAMPAAYLLAIVPIYALAEAWREGGGRYYPSFVWWLLGGLLVVVAASNIHTYFVRQANDFAAWNAHSAPETITANLLNEIDGRADAHVISLYHGHPTLDFLARDVEPYARLETNDLLPIRQAAGRDVALIMDTERRALFDEARRLYPNAWFEEFRPPFGGPTVIYYVYLSQADVADLQGLTGFYYRGEAWQGSPALVQNDARLAFDWTTEPPLDGPFSVEWRGVLAVEEYGPHQFLLQSPGHVELYVGEELILDGAGEMSSGVVLAKGNHALRVAAVGGDGPFSLAWRPPDRGPELVPASALYVPPVSSNGLLGRYFANDDWQGPETFAQIDPRLSIYFHITPLARPYTVEWSGKIAIPESGTYTFGLQSIDEATLTIDDEEIASSLARNEYGEGRVELAQGLHDIRLRYADRTDHTYLHLFWTAPGGQRQIVPSEVLFPPQGNYEYIEMPDLGQLAFDPNAQTPPAVVGAPLAGDVERVASSLEQPKGLAVGDEGRVYVAEPSQQRVQILDASGAFQAEITGGARPLVEPFDVAVDGAGQLYVLDAGDGGAISVFDGDGSYLFDVPVDESIVDRSRGISVDNQGRIWIANTPGGRIVAVDQEGAVLLEFPVWSGEEAQPVDVVVGANGDIFVADAGLYKLIRYSPEGRRLLAWDIPVANSMDGPHLAVDAAGALYITAPEKAQVTQYGPGGELIGSWALQGLLEAPSKPVGIDIDEMGTIWLADSGGQVLRLIPEAAP